MKIKGYAMYTYTNALDTKYDPCWKTTIICSKEERNRITEATGIKASRTDGDEFEALGDYQFQFKRKEEKSGKAKGKKNTPPKVYIDGALVPNDESPIIGNGSLVEVDFIPYNWTFKGATGTSGDFNKIRVLEMVEYAPTVTEGTESDEGTEETEDDGDDW